ncbi:MAG: glycosyltransferase [Odoribacter sp.]
MEKIKVCHLTSVHSAKDIRIFKKQCCSLAKAGYEVYIIAPNAVSEEIEGVKIIGVPVRKEGRFYRMFCLTNEIFQKALEVDAAIYHFHDPELLPIGLKLKRKGKKVIFDSHEDVPQQILSKEYIPLFLRYIISSVYSIYEGRIIHKFDATITVNENILHRLKRNNINSFIVSNYPETTSCCNTVEKENRICFAGAINEGYLHHKVVEVLNKIDDIRYSLAGQCDLKYLEKLKQMPGWEKVDYYGVIPFSDVLLLYGKSKIGIAIHDYTPNVGGKEGSLGILKNFEFMAAGIPIICTDFNVWRKIIEEEKCGICVDPHNLLEIESAIKYLINNPEEAKRMGDNGRKAIVERYNWQNEKEKLLSLYTNLLYDTNN